MKEIKDNELLAQSRLFVLTPLLKVLKLLA